MVEPALDGLQKALDNGDVRTVIVAARTVLDRAGFAPSRQVDAWAEAHQYAETLAAVLDDALDELGVDHNDHAVRLAVANAVRRLDDTPTP